MLKTLAHLYLRGVPVNWTGFDRPYARRKLSLPTYPFQRERYWIDEVVPAAATIPKQPRRRSTIASTKFVGIPRPSQKNTASPTLTVSSSLVKLGQLRNNSPPACARSERRPHACRPKPPVESNPAGLPASRE